MSSAHAWIVLFLLSVKTSDIGVYGRVLSLRTTEEYDAALRMDVLKRWRRGIADAHRERCAELITPWIENTQAPRGDATLLQLHVRPFSPRVSHGLLFPGKSLFSFVRRLYHCCQQKVHCRSVKGIQGRLRGEADVEFLLLREIASLTVTRAELHLQLANPQHVDIRPVLPFLEKRNLPTRYSSWMRGDVMEIRVDLQFLIKSLQEAAGGATSSGPSLVNMRRVEKPLKDSDVAGDGTATGIELGLVLDCSPSCKSSSVHLSHAPFIALYYK